MENKYAYIPAHCWWNGQTIDEYPMGTILRIKSAPVCYRIGIGCLKTVKDFFRFRYKFNEDETDKLIKVEILGETDERDERIFTNAVKLLGFVNNKTLSEAYSEYKNNERNINTDGMANANFNYYNYSYRNYGVYNTGDYNSGEHNFGDCNSGNYNYGCFNTTDNEQTITMFNKPSNWTMQKWQHSSAHDAITEMLSYWNPQDVWNLWRRYKLKQVRDILNLPNFDSDIFKELTGVDVNYLTWIDISSMFGPLFSYYDAVTDPDFTDTDEFGNVIFDETVLSKEKRQQVKDIITNGKNNGDTDADIDASIFSVLTWNDFHLPWRKSESEPELFTLTEEEYIQKTGEEPMGYECMECGCVFYGRYHSKYSINKVICPVCRDDTDSLFIRYK